MRPDLKVVAARKVKKELTQAMRATVSRKDAVYDNINQHAVCDGKYGEPELGIKIRKQSQKGRRSVRPVCRLLPPLRRNSFLPREPTMPARKLGRGEPSSSPVGSATVFPKFKLRLVRG